MSGPPSKTCFVTIGATASFSGLIKAVLSAEFCKALGAQRYTNLLVQYGQDGTNLYEQCLQQAREDADSGLEIHGFDIDKAGLGRYMRQAKGDRSNPDSEGVIISHAGM